MQTLLKVFPEEEGRFVDEPFGSTDQMPEEARPLYETFRVVVPTVDDIEKNLARLFSASSYLKIRKITRYDRDPGAAGLPGFRGVWCQTENKDDVGFSIVTINQNRFLIWAKMGYYPAYGNDSINPKVRDQYARDVSQYLAGVDLKVPENVAPEAGGRGLPEWMGLYRQTNHLSQQECLDSLDAVSDSEIHEWGMHGCIGFIPTKEVMEVIIENATDTVWANRDLASIHDELDRALAERPVIQPIAWNGEGIGSAWFVIDRFGRMRYVTAPDECGGGYVDITTLFPGTPILTAGSISTFIRGDNHDRNTWVMHVSPISSSYFLSLEFPAPQHQNRDIEAQVKSLGHLFKLLRSRGIDFSNTLILRSSSWAW